MIEAGGKAVSDVANVLKDRPLALALVIVNVAFLLVTSFVLWTVKESGERRDVLVSSLVANCQQPAPRRDP